MSANLFPDLLCPIGRDLFEDPIVVPCCTKTFSRAPLKRWFQSLPAGDPQTCPNCRAELIGFDVDTVPRNLTIAGLVDTIRAGTAIPERPKAHLWSAKLQKLPCNKVGELTLSLHDAKFTVQPTLFIAVVDNSGSMAGTAFNQVKTALLHIISMAQHNTSVVIKVVVYNSVATILPLTGVLEADQQLISRLTAGGGTNFAEAFRY